MAVSIRQSRISDKEYYKRQRNIYVSDKRVSMLGRYKIINVYAPENRAPKSVKRKEQT